MSGVQLGVIADDFTGAVDVANMLAQNGLTTQIAPGVPAMRAADRDLVLTLKSGNFGGPAFLADAAEVLRHG